MKRTYIKMNRDEDVDKFWDLIEREFAVIFPKYLRNILKLMGYDNATTVRAITQADIDEKFESFAKNTMMEYMPQNANKEDYLFYFENVDSFKIPTGHKILLKSVVEYVKKMTDINGVNYFNFYQQTSSVKTIGRLALGTQKSRVVNDVTANKASVPTINENYSNRVNADTECNNLFEKIKAWMTNNHQLFKAKCSYPVRPDLIDMDEEMDEENNSKKYVAWVPCPICGEKKRVAEVFTKNASSYMSTSNYHRHVQGCRGVRKTTLNLNGEGAGKSTNITDEESSESCSDIDCIKTVLTEKQNPSKNRDLPKKSLKITDPVRESSKSSSSSYKVLEKPKGTSVSNNVDQMGAKTNSVFNNSDVSEKRKGKSPTKAVNKKKETENLLSSDLDESPKQNGKSSTKSVKKIKARKTWISSDSDESSKQNGKSPTKAVNKKTETKNLISSDSDEYTKENEKSPTKTVIQTKARRYSISSDSASSDEDVSNNRTGKSVENNVYQVLAKKYATSNGSGLSEKQNRKSKPEHRTFTMVSSYVPEKQNGKSVTNNVDQVNVMRALTSNVNSVGQGNTKRVLTHSDSDVPVKQTADTEIAKKKRDVETTNRVGTNILAETIASKNKKRKRRSNMRSNKENKAKIAKATSPRKPFNRFG